MLTERLRYRLTGTLFLVAVAAIVAPLVFDGDGVEPMTLDPLPREALDVRPDQLPPPDTRAALEARRALEAAVDADAFATDTGTRWGEPVLTAEQDARDAGMEGRKWAVQLGSFARDGAARSLLARVQADGYAGFPSKVKRGGDVYTRVAVGPFINRNDAARMKSELDDRYDVNAAIVRYSP